MNDQTKPEQRTKVKSLSHKFIHDIRSELFGIEISAKSVHLYMSQLLKAYYLAKEAGLGIDDIPPSHIELLESAGPDIKMQLDSVNGKATLFLNSIDNDESDTDIDLNHVQNTSSLQEQRRNVNKILLVEDEEIHRDIATHVLKPYNCLLHFAENGLIAAEKFKEQSYDLVLMDLHMPILNGVETIKVIRALEKKGSQTPVIGISNIEPVNPEEFFAAGFNKFLLKPLTLDRFREALTELYPHRKV